MFDLSGKVAVVTGGNGGVGLAYGRGLVKAGASVAIWGRNSEKNAQAAKELRSLGGRAEAFICDVTSVSSVTEAFDATIASFGQVDCCFANAGGGGFSGATHSIDRQQWLDAIDLNVMSVVQTWQPMIGHFLDGGRGGRLVVTSSIAARMGMAGAAGYSTTKAAVEGLVKALAVELGGAGVRVNAILPGYMETEMSLNLPQAMRDACLRRSAIGRYGELKDMEGVAVFLASTESDFMTGQSLVMDGGHTIFPA